MRANTYDGHTAKFLATIATVMRAVPADVMQGWIENPVALRKALDSALLPPAISTAPVMPYPVWQEIMVFDKTRKQFRNELVRRFVSLSHQANELANKISYRVLPRENRGRMRLARVQLKHLRFTESATLGSVVRRLQVFGHRPCEGEVALSLALEVKEDFEPTLLVTSGLTFQEDLDRAVTFLVWRKNERSTVTIRDLGDRVLLMPDAWVVFGLGD